MLVGVLVVPFPGPLEHWSFDWPHLVRPQSKVTEVAIVEMDDASHSRLQQHYDAAWDYKQHAELLAVLTQSKAKAVVFDVVFSERGSNADLLADAIRTQGHVALASDLGTGDYYG